MRKYKPRLTKQDKKIGNRIQKLRKERQLTQEGLADKVNVTAQHLSYIENGHRRPSLLLARRLARELKVMLGELLKQ